MAHRMKHRVEYAALRLLAGVIRRLPYRVALGLGWGVAVLLHYGVGFRRAEARRRIRQVFGPALPARRVRRIAWRSWRNLCFNAVEIVRVPRMDRDWIARHHDEEGIRRLAASIPAGEGAVLAVPHAGNWDVAGVALHLFGLPMFFLARRQRNPLADAYLNRMRGATGVTTVQSDARNLRAAARRLKAGMYLAILPDVRARTPGLRIPFLGGEANLAPGMALFARLAGVAIYPVFLRRAGWTPARMRLFDPVRPDPSLSRDADLERMTRTVVAHFDEAIRADPEQYFWYNKRWVLDPLEEDAPVS